MHAENPWIFCSRSLHQFLISKMTIRPAAPAGQSRMQSGRRLSMKPIKHDHDARQNMKPVSLVESKVNLE